MAQDILESLSCYNLEHVIHKVFENLSLFDLQSCQLVSRLWYSLVQRLWEHHEELRVGRGWSQGNPRTKTVQCNKTRAVCTVSDIAIDEAAMAVALASSGNVELWDIRKVEQCGQYDIVDDGCRIWTAHTDDEGVYSIDMNEEVVVSGGEDGHVKVWSRADGTLTHTFDHHDYIVSRVQLWMGKLFSHSHDCSVAFVQLSHPDIVHKITGPLSWSDVIGCDSRSKYLAMTVDNDVSLEIANLSDITFDLNQSETKSFPEDSNNLILKGQ